MLIRELDNDSFEKFRDIIYRESGIRMSPMKKALVQSRLMRRMRELKLDGYTDYYGYLIENYSTELVNFINCITTNKTEFFRESAHFSFMNEKVLPDDFRERKELRIWCAGCSTGEEAYTIAITLLEFYRNRKMPAIKILATDIDTQVLSRAINGMYSAESVEAIESDVAHRYFLKGKGENEGFFKVKDALKEKITFRRLNLLDEKFPMKKKFDIIFCRNVVIYFDKETQTGLFKRFYGHLADDGYLFIGHSETLTTVPDLFMCRGKSIYTKVV